MKKAAIITILDYNNYGNRLQNYAVKKTFEKLGYEVESLECNDIEFERYKKRKEKLLLKKYKLNAVVNFFNIKSLGKIGAQRYKLFEQFTSNYLSPYYEPNWNEKVKNKILRRYDLFVLGSDQIWNPKMCNTPNVFFATFADKNKKVCFSPSLGSGDFLSDSQKEKYKEYLSDIDNISVREPEGAKLIYDLTGQNAEVLPDPTFMLDKSEWMDIGQKPQNAPNGNFILTIFLGRITDEYRKFIDDVSLEYSLPVINIGAQKNGNEYITGPSEYLWYINNCDIMLTDSFHATVFSIIYKTPFLTFPLNGYSVSNNKKNMFTRIDNLLQIFSLKNRVYGQITAKELKDIDFTNSESIFEKKRKEAFDYFSNVLHFQEIDK